MITNITLLIVVIQLLFIQLTIIELIKGIKNLNQDHEYMIRLYFRDHGYKASPSLSPSPSRPSEEVEE